MGDGIRWGYSKHIKKYPVDMKVNGLNSGNTFGKLLCLSLSNIEVLLKKFPSSNSRIG
jgi:hypothetical protein